MSKKNFVILKLRKYVCESFLQILWNEGLIAGYKIYGLHNDKVKIFLKYSRTGKPVINSLKCLSKPGKRLYYSPENFWKLNSSKILIVFSTNKGLKTINQCKKEKIGGELLFEIS